MLESFKAKAIWLLGGLLAGVVSVAGAVLALLAFGKSKPKPELPARPVFKAVPDVALPEVKILRLNVDENPFDTYKQHASDSGESDVIDELNNAFKDRK